MRSGRIDRKDCGSTPSFAANSGRLVHHDHVTPGREFTQNLQTFWLRVIEAQAPLVSVHAQEPERFSVEEWWSPGARVIADPRALDLEDLGAHVGEQHRRKWTCDRGGKIEDADSREKIEALTRLYLREASEGEACIWIRQHRNSVPHRTHQPRNLSRLDRQGFRHEIERAFVFAEDGRITAETLSQYGDSRTWPPSSFEHAQPRSPSGSARLKEAVERVESELVRDAMARHRGNKKRVAKDLGISRSYLCKKLGLSEETQ